MKDCQCGSCIRYIPYITFINEDTVLFLLSRQQFAPYFVEKDRKIIWRDTTATISSFLFIFLNETMQTI